MKARVKAPILFVLILVLGMSLSQCTPGTTPPPSPGFSVTCETTAEYQSLVAGLTTNPYYIEEQVILTGETKLVAELATDLGLAPIAGCQVGPLDQLPAAQLQEEAVIPDKDEPEAPAKLLSFYNPQDGNFAVGDNELALNLYKIIDSRSVEDVIKSVSEVQGDTPRENQVYADPNYLVGHLANSPCGNPFGVEGSPFGVEGSPFGVEGSPGGGQSAGADPQSFWAQWAFDRIGLSQPAGDATQYAGYGVPVAVFDTSPYSQPEGDSAQEEPILVVTPALTLTVHHPFTLLPLTSTAATPVNVSDHGLFVAGLVHAVAPGSQIHLYRVLDDSGCGDLFHLSAAVLQFVAQIGGSGSEPVKSVINLSLGVRRPRVVPDAIKSPSEYHDFLELESGIEALEFALGVARRSGAVIVAAAGNDSVRADNPGDPQVILGMQLPAAYPYVIGVAASDPDNLPACYTNRGDVIAPGGGAEYATPAPPDPAEAYAFCKALADSCSFNEPDCPHGVISLTNHAGAGLGYSHWVGTSFATPLTSGLAALHYQNVGQGAVFGRIQADLQLVPNPGLFGRGLIQVP
ncbi:MAG TPA: S8/S53 family peptidase [Anaerolineales bacterium]|nr:S8/S53 family peptidase [Anaerolineales bacterium]